MRAVKQRVDAPAHLREGAVHFVVDRVQRTHVEQPAADAGLVRRDHDPVAGMIQLRDRLEAARNGLPFGGVLDELIAVLVDDTVAIEDD